MRRRPPQIEGDGRGGIARRRLGPASRLVLVLVAAIQVLALSGCGVLLETTRTLTGECHYHASNAMIRARIHRWAKDALRKHEHLLYLHSFEEFQLANPYF